jgi:hypothetical protein
MVTILVGILLGYQAWSVFENTTTIEALEKQRVQRWLEKNKHKDEEIEFPYDTSLSENLEVVFGTLNPLLWLWPWTVTSHSGLDFPVVEDAELPWPPPDMMLPNELAPPTSELPWKKAYRHETFVRLRRRIVPDEESGESELSDEDESRDGDDEDGREMFDGWFGNEDLEDYGVDADNEIRGLRKDEEGIMWEEVLRSRREDN